MKSGSRRSRRHRNPQQENQQNEPFFHASTDAPVKSKDEPFFKGKLSMGREGDQYEQEADAMANTVVGGASDAKQMGVKSLSTPDEEQMPATNDGRMAEDKQIQEKSALQHKDAEEEPAAKAMEPEEEPVMAKEEEESPKAMAAEEEEPAAKAMAAEEEEPAPKAMAAEEEEPAAKAMAAEEEEPAAKAMAAEEEEPAAKAMAAEEEEPAAKAMAAEEEEPAAKAMAAEEEEPAAKAMAAEEEEPAKSKSGSAAQIFQPARTKNHKQDLKTKNTPGAAPGISTGGAPQIQAKMGDGHDLSSGKFSGNKDLESVFDNHAALRRGSTGAAVTLVQEALMNLGYALPTFGADGDFGKETEAAVRAFQQDTGAAVDGVVGAETIGFLDRRVQGKPLAPPTAPVLANAPLNPKNVIVEPGATPIHAPTLGTNTYGFTDTETVSIDISAIKVGNSWQAVVNGLTGNYSLRTRLLPGQQEVDPGSNTSAATFCAQATEISNLGNPAATAAWYMESAVLAHERIHATRLRPALLAVAPTIEAQVEAITIPDFLAADAASAAAILRLHPAFWLAAANARTVWDAQYVTLINADHNAGGPTDAAEHQVVDPVVNRICRMARANGWGPCPGVC